MRESERCVHRAQHHELMICGARCARLLNLYL